MISILLLLLCLGWIWLIWGEFTWKTCGLLLLLLFFEVIVYYMSYHHLDMVYSEIENISEIMTDVMEEDGEPPAEEYKEGAVGILYTNFYKW